MRCENVCYCQGTDDAKYMASKRQDELLFTWKDTKKSYYYYWDRFSVTNFSYKEFKICLIWKTFSMIVIEYLVNYLLFTSLFKTLTSMRLTVRLHQNLKSKCRIAIFAEQFLISFETCFEMSFLSFFFLYSIQYRLDVMKGGKICDKTI